jgi:hypothetical protein
VFLRCPPYRSGPSLFTSSLSHVSWNTTVLDGPRRSAINCQVHPSFSEIAMPDRIQQEIEELLARLDTFPPKRSLRTRLADWLRRRRQAVARFFAGLPVPSISAGHVLLLAIGVIVTVYLWGGRSDLARWLLAAGILLFIAAFVLSLRRQSRPPEKLWRGQPLDVRPGAGNRGRSWWGRWRNRR